MGCNGVRGQAPPTPCVSMVTLEVLCSPRVKVEMGVMASDMFRMREGADGVRLHGMDRRPREPSMAAVHGGDGQGWLIKHINGE